MLDKDTLLDREDLKGSTVALFIGTGIVYFTGSSKGEIVCMSLLLVKVAVDRYRRVEVHHAWYRYASEAPLLKHWTEETLWLE